MDPIHIYHENSKVLVCEKPAGLVSEEGGLPDVLCEQLEIGKLYPIHRLDKAVSGGIVYAKTKEAAADLSDQIQNGLFHKTYIAAAEGRPPDSEGTWEDIMFYDRRQGKSYVVNKERHGTKKASMGYKVLNTFLTDDGMPCSFLQLEMHTGRTHQIRAQLASRQMPVFGDRRYGSKTKSSSLGLRSYRISFIDPEDKKPIELEFPVPDRYPWNHLKQKKQDQ